VTLVDTNVLLDLITDAPVWADWSIRQLDAAAIKGPITINGVVYAELPVRFERIEDLDEVLAESGITLEEVPRAALFLAGIARRAASATASCRTSSSCSVATCHSSAYDQKGQCPHLWGRPG